MNTVKTMLSTAIGIVGVGAAFSVIAAPLGTYDAVINKSSPACLVLGDAISCSAPLLNFLEGKDVTADVSQGGYVLPTPQGPLDSYIVVAAGGGAQGNDDTDPTDGEVEDGFKTTDTNPDSFLATGQADGTSVLIGNMNDPANNLLSNALDTPGTWDVGVDWLIGALTLDGIRRELTIGFDYNQPSTDVASSLDYWTLVTVRGFDDAGNALPDINFEIGNFNNPSPFTFESQKSFASMPASTDFSTVNGVTCVDTNDTEAIPILPIPGGQCPAGYEERIVNTQSTAATTIFAFLPELNNNLEQYSSLGYDVISTRMLLGCFGGTPAQSFRPGLGYLSDEANGGATTNCEGGGFADVFLLAGAPMDQRVPEPGTLALLGGALLAGVVLRRRRND